MNVSLMFTTEEVALIDEARGEVNRNRYMKEKILRGLR